MTSVHAASSWAPDSLLLVLIYALIYQYIYLFKTFHKSLKLFDGKMKPLYSIYIATTNSISTVGFNLKLRFILRAY